MLDTTVYQNACPTEFRPKSSSKPSAGLTLAPVTDSDKDDLETGVPKNLEALRIEAPGKVVGPVFPPDDGCGGKPDNRLGRIAPPLKERVQSLIKPHLELRPIQILLESSTRAIQFSEGVKGKARTIICHMLHQTAERSAARATAAPFGAGEGYQSNAADLRLGRCHARCNGGTDRQGSYLPSQALPRAERCCPAESRRRIEPEFATSSFSTADRDDDHRVCDTVAHRECLCAAS